MSAAEHTSLEAPDPTEHSRALQELSCIKEISRILEGSTDLRQAVQPVLSSLSRHLGLDHGTLTLLNRRSSRVAIDLAHDITPMQAQRGQYELGEGITGQVVKTGEPAVIPRTSECEAFLNRTRRGTSPDVSFICVPIKVGTEVYGALSADRPFCRDSELLQDVQLLSVVASMIAQAVKVRRDDEEERERLTQENERLRARLQDQAPPINIIGTSHEMREVYEQIATVSTSATTVLIHGETGTGKELVAQAIHDNSPRGKGPFVKVHCAALPESLIESELFGHVRGAFTGAVADRKGRFEQAHGGTIFLDEIAEIPPSLQIKLLRVLQEREFERLGGQHTKRVDVRVITAANKDLAKLVAEGTFREDLYYRLHVFPIYVPPLRKRKADIALLADYFIEKYAGSSRRPVRRLSSAAIDMLMSYHWPGNVRELENCIERAVLVAEDKVIHPCHLPPTLQTAESSGSAQTGSLKYLVGAYERDLIRDCLKSTNGNMAAAARTLGTTPRIIAYKVKIYDIDPTRYSS